jgi:SNF2 family DNA or RNA helicase
MVIYQLVHQAVIMKRISLEGNKVIFRFSFCRNTIKELKTLGARFNPTEKNWYLPVGKVHRVLDLSGDDWDISCEVTDLLEAYRRERELEFHYNLDEPFSDGRVLYQHQKEAVEWALRTLKTDCRGGILALDMGLGKTLVALAVAKIYQQHFPDVKNLVICPALLKENWRREAHRRSCGNILMAEATRSSRSS